MDSKSLKLIYFSPTKTTASIVNSIAEGIAYKQISYIDLTLPDANQQDLEPNSAELTIIGAPVYSGRIPKEAVRRLQKIKGNHGLAVIVVVYGNRAYEDALLELKDIAIAQGFQPIAAGAFIGEHSYSCEFTAIANGRPDIPDSDKARQFGLSIQKKISQLKPFEPIPQLTVPGNFPYKIVATPAEMAPVVDESLCALCGDCIDICPTGAIELDDTIVTDQSLCIFCSACIKMCPTEARQWESPVIDQIRNKLSQNCQERKEPEMYI